MLAAALAFAAYNFFFLEPRFSFVIGHPSDVLTFVIFLAVAGVTERPVQAVAPPVPDRVSVPAVTTNPGGAVIPAGVPEKSWQ